jgi:hypothetical protein
MQVVKTKEGKIEETGNVVTTCRPIESKINPCFEKDYRLTCC